MTSTTPVLTDPRPALLGAADQAVALVGLVTPDRLGDPTPCSEYDVRHLVGHLVAVLRRIGYVAGGGHAFDVPSIVLDLPGDGWLLAAEANAADLRAAWADDAVLDRVLRLPWGEVSGRGAALAYVQELSTHAWDLATALGRTELLDPALGELALGAARRYVPAQPRGGPIPFEAPVDVPADARVYEQLVAWLGRDPQWTAR